MKERDTLHKFLFEQAAIRGEVVHLDATWSEVLKRHAYPPVLRRLLGEMMAAASLLAATLKFEGSLILQLQGDGPVRLGVVECSSDQRLRGLLRWEGEVGGGSLHELVGPDGRLLITIQQGSGERYQGVVAVSGEGIAGAIEAYLLRSEQLETRLWLAADGQSAAGLLLQRMPSQDRDDDADAWPRVLHLAGTVTANEMLDLDAAELLHRLFHEEDLRLFEGEPVAFRCTCSRERMANALRAMGRDEVRGLLDEEGNVEVTCEFCNQTIRFDAVDVEALFSDGSHPGDPSQCH